MGIKSYNETGLRTQAPAHSPETVRYPPRAIRIPRPAESSYKEPVSGGEVVGVVGVGSGSGGGGAGG